MLGRTGCGCAKRHPVLLKQKKYAYKNRPPSFHAHCICPTPTPVHLPFLPAVHFLSGFGCPTPNQIFLAANWFSDGLFPAKFPFYPTVCAIAASLGYGFFSQKDAAAQYRQTLLHTTNAIRYRDGRRINRLPPAKCGLNRPCSTGGPIILSLRYRQIPFAPHWPVSRETESN